MKETEDMSFEDSENYKGSNAKGIKEISLNLFQKAMNEGSKEMTEGGIYKRVINGEVIEFVAPNQKEIFINTIEMLDASLIPHFSMAKSKELKIEYENLKKDKENIDKDFNNEIKRINEMYKDKINSPFQSSKLSFIAQFNNEIKNNDRNYEMSKIRLYKKMLVLFSKLLADLNYFNEEGEIVG